jgi:uncharacterized protein
MIMNAFEMVLILFSGSLCAGFIGSLSGLGGGIVIVPLLVIALHVDIHYAIGASIIAVIATSTGASSAYIKEGYSNIRVGLLLETATSLGAIFGVALGSQLPSHVLYLAFGFVLLYCAFSSFYFAPATNSAPPPNKLAAILKLDSCYPSQGKEQLYHVQNVTFGYFIMFIAGSVSGILGIGSGALKVLALDKVMKLPFKVSTTTSNFMIGVTAAASAGIYLNLGYIDPLLTMPVMLGVTGGSLAGARLLPHMKTATLRHLFGYMILAIAFEMIQISLMSIYKGNQ